MGQDLEGERTRQCNKANEMGRNWEVSPTQRLLQNVLDPQPALAVMGVRVGLHSGHMYLRRCWPYIIQNQRTTIRSKFLLL